MDAYVTCRRVKIIFDIAEDLQYYCELLFLLRLTCKYTV